MGPIHVYIDRCRETMYLRNTSHGYPNEDCFRREVSSRRSETASHLRGLLLQLLPWLRPLGKPEGKHGSGALWGGVEGLAEGGRGAVGQNEAARGARLCPEGSCPCLLVSKLCPGGQPCTLSTCSHAVWLFAEAPFLFGCPFLS